MTTNLPDLVDLPELDYHEQDYLAFESVKFEVVAELLRTINPQTVLDIGVSAGIFYAAHLPDYLAEGRVHGVEIADDFIAVACERGVKAKKLNIEAEPLPYEDHTFDAVVCDSMLEHTLRPRQMLEEIARVLKPSGTLILAVPSATGAVRRYALLRGNSPYEPLIRNLVTKDYLKECSIPYSPRDLAWLMKRAFMVDRTIMLNMTGHDSGKARKVVMAPLRFLGKVFPQLRDVIIVTAHPSP